MSIAQTELNEMSRQTKAMGRQADALERIAVALEAMSGTRQPTTEEIRYALRQPDASRL